MRCILILVLVCWLPAVAAAQLTPGEVAVIAMAESDQSRGLAEYYVKARDLPPSQIFLLEGKPAATMRRAAWQNQARPAIRAWLRDNGLEEKIRCFVTTWDVPLRIGKRGSDAPQVVARQEFLTRARANLIKALAEAVKRLASLAPEKESSGEKPPGEQASGNESASGKSAAETTATAEPELATLIARFESAFAAAGKRMQASESEAEKKRLGVLLQRAFLAGGGINGLLQLATRKRPGSQFDPAKDPRLERLRGQLQGVMQGLKALESMADTTARDTQMLGLMQTASGLVGTIKWIDQQRQLLEKNETHASFDSELSLLHWPDYQLFRWQPNLLHYRYDHLVTLPPRPLIVARLEAPTYDLAKRLIDTAIATEKTGLGGKVYLDARGIKFDPAGDKRGSYGEYDQSLRDLAGRLKTHTKLEVVLDDQAKLFQDGDCPQAALYCGWYSLAKYVDAFDWRGGAVGYHLASAEATTLRTPGGKVWCNAMLEDGIGATLGPVHEPYLASFPLPDDFFSLLLTGRYTLAEVYYRTKPCNSWAMVLVGDPLYNPFKKNPLLSEDALPDRMKQGPAADAP